VLFRGGAGSAAGVVVVMVAEGEDGDKRRLEERLSELEGRLNELEERLVSLRKLLKEAVQFCLRLERDLPWLISAVEEARDFLLEDGHLPDSSISYYVFEFRKYLEERWRNHREAAKRRAKKLRRLERVF